MIPLTSSERTPLLTQPFVLLSLAHFLHGLALHLYVHVPGFLKQLGAHEMEIGFIFGITAGVAIIARPFVGRAMDVHGRRSVILLGGVLHVVVCLLYFSVTSRGPWMMALRALHGLAEAALFSSLFTLAADIVPASRRTEGIAIFGVSGLLPIAAGGLIGDVVLGLGGYRELFALSAAFAAVACLASLPVNDIRKLLAEGDLPARGFFKSVLDAPLLPLWFIGIVFATALASIFVFIKTYVLEKAVGSVGSFLAMYVVAACLLRLCFGWVPDRVGPKRALLPAIATLALGLLLLASATTEREVLIAGVLSGLGHGFSFPILAGLVVSRARPSERGSAIGLFTAIFDFGMLIGGPLFGAVARFAGYAAMYRTAAMLCFVGLVVYAAWDTDARLPANKPQK